jgi:hypothetical protein
VEQPLRHFLDALERRRRVTRAIDLYLELLFVTSLTAAILLLSWRLVPIAGLAELPVPSRAAALAAIGLILAAPLGAALGRAAREPAGRAAAEADRALRLEERLLTAAELLDRPGHPVRELLLGDVAPRLRGRRPERVYPMPAIGYRAGLLLALLALGIVALAPADLTWQQLKRNPMSIVGLGSSDPPAPEPTVPARLELVGLPREGKAPLKVYFLGYADRAVETWEWDFGDGTVVRGDRQQDHAYEKPGLYTVTLRAGGGERVEKDYILVRGPNDPGGGGGGRPPMPNFQPPSQGRGAVNPNPGERPKVETTPHSVTPLDAGGAEMVQKERAISTPGPGAAGPPEAAPPPFEKVYAEYRRVAEESIGRERIPVALADYVRAYFDRIRPK